MPNLKKSVYFTICGEEICLDVTWHMLEKAERLYGLPVDVIPYLLQDAIKVPRTKVAEMIALWVQDKTKLTRDEIKEHYFRCPQMEYIRAVGKIQACICWSIRGDDGEPQLSDEGFDELVNGRDLKPEHVRKPKGVSEVSDKPKKPRAATSKKRTA